MLLYSLTIGFGCRTAGQMEIWNTCFLVFIVAQRLQKTFNIYWYKTTFYPWTNEKFAIVLLDRLNIYQPWLKDRLCTDCIAYDTQDK